MQVGLRRCFPTLRVLILWNSLAGDALEAERVEHCTFLKGIPGLHVDSRSRFVSPGPRKTFHASVWETGRLKLAPRGNPSAQHPLKAMPRAPEIFPDEK